MNRAGISFGLIAVLLLAGCAADPKQAAVDECTKEAQLSSYRDDPETPDTVTVSGVSSYAAEGGGAAYNVDGTTRVTYPNAADVTSAWTCFAQTSNGETHAAIQSFD